MAIYCGTVLPKSLVVSPPPPPPPPPLQRWSRSNDRSCSSRGAGGTTMTTTTHLRFSTGFAASWKQQFSCGSTSSSGKAAAASSASGSVPSLNYMVPLENSAYYNPTGITRPLAEILRDLNKRISDGIINKDPNDKHSSTFISWYHANRMLSFYAPGWCGEICDVIFSDNGSVTVVYRVTIRGSDGEAHRESTGTASPGNGIDLVAVAEEIAFCRACARFGLGLYLYHEE